MVQAKGIDLASLLRFDPESGRILLQDYRMVLLSACAMGALRKELIETMGWAEARALMKRFGHAAGLADGLALMERFPDASMREHLDFGPALHALEGAAHVVRAPDSMRLDPQTGEVRYEAFWENSYEAEQHLELFGRSEEPVCWTLVGYATGHSSAAAGRRVVVREHECIAMGHERCRLVADVAEAIPEEALAEERDYETRHLPEQLDDLLTTLKRQKRTLSAKARRIRELEKELAGVRRDAGLIGASSALKEAQATARTVAPVDASVLLLGESGTGKELFARMIHERSLRSGKTFLAVNCSALPETLQEAELFGYAKGAFTGAAGANPGVFEAAGGGTLFLDEIGDLSLSAQAKILRALQEGEVKRLGETRARKVDVRIVAATHRDLVAMTQAGTFREDLYYRLGVVSIDIPPLRDRGNDVLLLAQHFLEDAARRFARSAAGFSAEAKRRIEDHDWPGNVRELRNAVERAVILSDSPEIQARDLPADVAAGRGGDAATTPLERANTADLEAHLPAAPDERERIRTALSLTGGRRERAAKLLGLSRTTLWRRMRALGLTEPPG